MKHWIRANYHLVILLVSVIVLVLSSAALISDHGSFLEKFRTAGETIPAASLSKEHESTSISEALEKLDHPVMWNSRRDGASPFVSRLYLLKNGILLDPLEQSQPLYPPVPNKWLFDHGLDYTDVRILERDPKHKGFTVLEEFLAGTDPNDMTKLPPLRTKLGYSETDIHKNSYVFEFVGIEEIDGRKEFQLRPLESLPNPSNKDSKGNIRSDRNTRSAGLGASIPGAEFLKVVEFKEKKKIINDTEYDVSELVLENSASGSRHTIIKKNPSREYQRTPIEIMESVQLHYQLTGATEEIIPLKMGQEFNLTSLDKKYHETYKFHRLSKEGIVLEKDGVSHTIKPVLPVKPSEPGGTSPTVTPNAAH